MKTGIVLLNYGEPQTVDRNTVRDYLIRIFMDNASLDGDTTEAEIRERSEQLAERRLPGLLEEYREIDGSPLIKQATSQKEALDTELDQRCQSVNVYHAMQHVDPLIPDITEQLAADEISQVIAVPVYPLCGQSTTVSSVNALEESIADLSEYNPNFYSITGWHRSPSYTRLRAENITTYLDRNNLEPNDSNTAFVFSAHGTPIKYLEGDSRYDLYVDEYTEMISQVLGIEEYHLGFQNHENRGIDWTEPDIETVIESLDESVEHVIVEPMSFMHEQSETLVELDIDLKKEAVERGFSFHRIPVPHDDDRFPALLADLVEPIIADVSPEYYQLRQCQCRPKENTYCLNAPFEN
ncbi:ferrochelatase [Salinarchaeum sp. IM2453]|uniref:ferrochelatase n=1 Tax=Salinarchaeum sp. IM2453 TaxID=2862870 RepID=UPI001C839D48|nr:ferrochelatase [Salinarchaeum sp. IM2453]QZA88154.1 ferrochelatase [Salinarchaeum sp. IM2453]